MESKGITDSGGYQTMDTPWSEEKFLEKFEKSMKRVEGLELPLKLVVDMERQDIPIALLKKSQCLDTPSSIEDGNLQQSDMESEAISDSESCVDQIVDFPWSEEDLLEEIQNSMKRLEDSELFPKVLEDMERHKILETLLKNFKCSKTPTSLIEDGNSQQRKNKLTMPESRSSKWHGRDQDAVVLVVLGVGSLEYEKSRLQLSLALLLKSRFPHLISKVSVYDPCLSSLEYRALTTLGCAPIEKNEKFRKQIHSPTVFIMPFCPFFLAEELVENNMNPWRLGWISILGNSLQQSQILLDQEFRPWDLKEIKKHVVEIPVDPTASYLDGAFRIQSWHLFPNSEIKLVSERKREIKNGNSRRTS